MDEKKYKFTAEDNAIMETELQMAQLLQREYRPDEKADTTIKRCEGQLRLLMSALGRKIHGDFSMDVKHFKKDHTFAVILNRI